MERIGGVVSSSVEDSSEEELLSSSISYVEDSSGDDDLHLIQAAITIGLLLRRRKRRLQKRKRARTVWVRSIFRRRQRQGVYHNLLQEMRLADCDSHFKFVRMSKETFDILLQKVNM